MAVKFEFILSDVDAQNLVSILKDERTRMLVQAGKHMVQTGQVAEANAAWYNRHADYLEELTKKILAGNTRVE